MSGIEAGPDPTPRKNHLAPLILCGVWLSFAGPVNQRHSRCDLSFLLWITDLDIKRWCTDASPGQDASAYSFGSKYQIVYLPVR